MDCVDIAAEKPFCSLDIREFVGIYEYICGYVGAVEIE